jgi:hypothetical protein
VITTCVKVVDTEDFFHTITLRPIPEQERESGPARPESRDLGVDAGEDERIENRHMCRFSPIQVGTANLANIEDEECWS